MTTASGDKAGPKRPDVFISYSRKDREFVKRLEAALQARGREVWVDWEGIRPAEEFMQAIFPAIEGTDTFVFVISPDSVTSAVCGRELAHAASHNKRMVPIFAREVDVKAIPEPLAKLNWVFFCRENEDFDVGTDTLISAIDTDLDWVHAHTRLLTRAIEWEAKGKNSSFVLRGVDLHAAEQWLAQAGTEKERQPTALQTEYIIASRKAAARRQRITLGAVTFALVVAIALAIVALFAEKKAERRGRIALSRQLSAQAVQRLDTELDLSLLLGVQATRVADTFEARSVLFSAIGRRGAGFLAGHDDAVRCLAFAPDDTVLASGGSGGTIMLWDLAARAALGKLAVDKVITVTEDKPGVLAVAFSADGKQLLAATNEGAIQWWKVTPGSAIGDNDKPSREPINAGSVLIDSITSATFNSNGTMAALGSEHGRILLWDLTAHQVVGSPLEGDSALIEDLAFSPDGKLLASGGVGETITIWDLATRTRKSIKTSHTHRITSVAFSPSGEVIASGGLDDSIQLWSVANLSPFGSHPQRYGHVDWVSHLAFSPDGRRLASASADRSVMLWEVWGDLPAGQRLFGHRAGTQSVAFSHDGRTLASAGGDRTVVLWNVDQGAPLGTRLTWHEATLLDVAVSPDGRMLAIATDDGKVLLWDAIARKAVGSLLTGPKGQVHSVAFDPRGRLLASAGFGGVMLWNISSRKPRGPALTDHKGWVGAVAFSPDGETLASGAQDGAIIFWNVATGRPIGPPLSRHDGPIASLAFSPDGKLLASAGWDHRVILWDVATKQPLGAPLGDHGSEIPCVAFSPDGRLLASGNQDVTLWNVATRAPVGSALSGHPGAVTTIAFSPDGKTLAAGAEEGIVLWDLTSNARLGPPLEGHISKLETIAFTPDGQTLISVADHSVMLWDVGLASWQRQACRSANRSLTKAEWRQFLPDEPYVEICAPQQSPAAAGPSLTASGSRTTR